MISGQSQTGPRGYGNVTSKVRAHWPRHLGFSSWLRWQGAHSNRQVSPWGPHSQNLLQSEQRLLSSDLETIIFLTVGVLVVVRLLGDGIDVLGAVRDHAAVIGETVLAGVVGDDVVWVLGSLLARDQGHQEYKKQI